VARENPFELCRKWRAVGEFAPCLRFGPQVSYRFRPRAGCALDTTLGRAQWKLTTFGASPSELTTRRRMSGSIGGSVARFGGGALQFDRCATFKYNLLTFEQVTPVGHSQGNLVELFDWICWR